MPTLSLLSLRNLTITVADFFSDEKILVDGLNLEIPSLKIVALVGGSGSGKTTTGLSILRLLPVALRVARGEIVFQSNNILEYPQEKMRGIRGKEIGMVFQEPLNAFNPVFTVGYQIAEVLKAHTPLTAQHIPERVQHLLTIVGIKDSPRISRSYPHQLSGGLRQRAMIAQAIAGGPKLLIADEPTSNLDVTSQAHIIELFRKLKEELRISILLITHDLGMVAHLADEVAVLSEGKVVERGETREVLENPQHPYTMELMKAMLVSWLVARDSYKEDKNL